MSRLFLAAIFPIYLLAQSGSGVISGTVKDASGSPVPAAQVKISNEQTGVSAVTVSNESGIYRAVSLVPGTYRLEVDAPGFERLVRPALSLQIGQALAADLTLSVGAQNETITVTEAGPLAE